MERTQTLNTKGVLALFDLYVKNPDFERDDYRRKLASKLFEIIEKEFKNE